MPVRVFVDFDGTITEIDTLVFLLDRYGGPAWREIEDRVEAGTLSEEQGLRDEIALIRAPWAEALGSVLAEVVVDPGFAAFAAWCRDRGWPLAILSGGLAPLIRAVLAREDLDHLALHANDLAFDGDGRWRVVPAATPRLRGLCNHCKSHWLEAARREGARVVYAGDGTTDRCPAERADLVFAKGALADWCAGRGMDHVPFARFDEVRVWLDGPAGAAWAAAAGAPRA
ncbi:MAG: MtnX-like HAD-IB family phosphatase [Candidatus Krumholzibacteriota bacterium]|nr:MtnX-like HAD-IB family phosphatase [Candidatus Krumholzibacteriota bacterium]